NRLTPPPDRRCGLCDPRRAAEREAIDALRRRLPGRPLRFLPAFDDEPRGESALRRVGQALAAPDRGASLVAGRSRTAKAARPAAGAGPPLKVPASLKLL